ncbi:hypothetical protein RhiirB3_395755 [Rhizophagus irregularis]|nr:hypothetical protein RhiirB3_395755 [Rhizophagus irregularis]
MASSNHIIIDWSKPIEHSFIQLGDSTSPQDFYDDITYDDEPIPSRTLSFQDIFFLDIDNILQPDTITGSFSEKKNYPFAVSFKKFHVTKIHKAGYNKIYNFRRSKSFFFEITDQSSNTNDIHLKIHTNDYLMSTALISYNSTSVLPNAKYQISKQLQHFFSAQRVIPRKIQKKYFSLIRKKLLERITFIKSRENKNDHCDTSTRTFFNFSYKKYHFYFGIYLPCQHVIEHKGLSIPFLCDVPSPLVRSNHRHGCDLHFHLKNFTKTIDVKKQ